MISTGRPEWDSWLCGFFGYKQGAPSGAVCAYMFGDGLEQLIWLHVLASIIGDSLAP
ncbi:MAG: hypothetical protein MI922_20380 [Bacteroidales bacterium]|nr:hypothetical protein [Bacteroidales bacterium]